MSDKNINNKYFLSKTKSQNELFKDQKTSTNDLDDNLPKKTILKKNFSSLGTPSNFQAAIQKNKTESLQALSRRKKHKIIPLIIYDLNELKNKITEINNKTNTEKIQSINIFNNLNNEIKIKILKIKKLSEEQNEIISNLKTIKSLIDNKIQKANFLIKKKSEDNKKEQKLSNLIKVKEKEIEFAMKSNEKIKKEHTRILKIYNNNNFIKEINLRKELLELENEISKLETDKRKLQTILEKHQYCDKHKNELLNYLSLLTKAYQFEIKKAALKDLTINSESEDETNNLKLEIINNNKSLPLFLSPKRKSIKTIFNQKKIIKSLNHKKSEKNILSHNAYEYIKKILNKINDEYRKESGKINNSNKLDYENKRKNLFNIQENNFLEKIIPNSYLIKCKERFDNIEKENNKLKEKINLNKIKNEQLISEKQIKIDIKELKIKSTKKEELKLKIDI